MCRSAEDGGRRCDGYKRLIKKQEYESYLEELGAEIPESLKEDIDKLVESHKADLVKQEAREARKEERIELEKARAERRQARLERSKKKDEPTGRASANKPVQLYLARKEHEELRSIAESTYLDGIKSEKTVNEQLDKAAQKVSQKNESSYIPRSEFEGSNSEYMEKHGINVSDVAKYNRGRLYDGVRERIEGAVVLTESGNGSIDGTLTKETVKKVGRGRVGTNQGENLGDGYWTRSNKTDLLLTEAGYSRVERIGRIFGLKRSDALRNQALGIDHRERQNHQSLKSYELRRLQIAKYESEDGGYRKKGESLESLYERLISDESIDL